MHSVVARAEEAGREEQWMKENERISKYCAKTMREGTTTTTKLHTTAAAEAEATKTVVSDWASEARQHGRPTLECGRVEEKPVLTYTNKEWPRTHTRSLHSQYEFSNAYNRDKTPQNGGDFSAVGLWPVKIVQLSSANRRKVDEARVTVIVRAWISLHTPSETTGVILTTARSARPTGLRKQDTVLHVPKHTHRFSYNDTLLIMSLYSSNNNNVIKNRTVLCLHNGFDWHLAVLWLLIHCI